MPREHFPRQSNASSGGAATSSASNVAIPTASSGSLDTTALQISGSVTATGVTSGLLSVSTSGTVGSPIPSAKTADLTTTSSSTPTASTSQSTPASQPSSSVLSTSSHTPTSSSSIPSQTTSSAASSSSSVPPSSTTQPPTPSSSQQGTLTTITSAYTTYVNGSPVVTETPIPSTIPELSGPSSSDRSAIIAGSAAGGTALLILLLSLAFCARRKRFKRLNFLDAITLRRKQDRSRATLLDGEDLHDVDFERPPRRYTDYETPWDARDSRDGNEHPLMVGRGTPGTSVPTLPSRWSETGSAFRGNVWPPPNEATRLMDPLANRDDLDLDLGRIVDDVMGPSATAMHFSDRSISSVYRGSVFELEGTVHSRTVSNASNAMLLEAAGLGGTLGVGPLSTAPVRSSPLTQPETKPGSAGHQGGDAS